MKNIEQYTTYDLPYADFNHSTFEANIGGKLQSNGWSDIHNQLVQEGEKRLFLKSPLTNEQLHHVNSEETLKAATAAEQFQLLVAQTIIKDNFEPMVNLRSMQINNAHEWSFTDSTYHEACGAWANKERLFWVRKSIGSKLSELAILLSTIDLKMHFEDGFRPLGVQEGLFKRRIDMAKASHPNWSDEQLILEARSKTAYTPRFAAHKAGAAVDVRLKDSHTDEFIDIGHDYPDGGEIVRLDTGYVTQEQWENRKILEAFSKKVGLTMYPFEDWHLSDNDATSAAVNGSPGNYFASFGPVKRFDMTSGEIQEVYEQDELDATFSLT